MAVAGGPALFEMSVTEARAALKEMTRTMDKAFGGGEYFLSQADMNWINGMYFADQGRDGSSMPASPILAQDLAGLPPALVITAGFDPLRDEGQAYANRLEAAGVAVEYRCFDSTIHGFMSFVGAIDAGREGLELVAARLRSPLAC